MVYPCDAENNHKKHGWDTAGYLDIQMNLIISSISSLVKPSTKRCLDLTKLNFFAASILHMLPSGTVSKLIWSQTLSTSSFWFSKFISEPTSSSIFLKFFPVVLLTFPATVLKRSLQELFWPSVMDFTNFRNLLIRELSSVCME
jgi:hypothetical protein